MRISRRTYVNLKQFLSRSNELVHSWNFFFRNSLHINITGGRPRMAQITEVENKERRDVSGSRLTRYELETRVDLLNDPSPVSSSLFFFLSYVVFFFSPYFIPSPLPLLTHARQPGQLTESETSRQLKLWLIATTPERVSAINKDAL